VWPYVVVVVVTIVIIVVWWWFWCGTQTTVMLIRHADRDGTVDALNAAGLTRRQELVHVMEKAALNAIIRSDTNRALQTAELVAQATGIAPIVIAQNDTQAVVDEIRNNHLGQTVLVVGHSTTVPAIIAGLGGPALPDIAGDEFDNLFALNLCRCSRNSARLVNLQYGAASP
jgi:broad specificity phosphatase PhoE